MHKSILIHNKNTPNTLQEKFNQENIIAFDYSNSDYKSIDEYISKVVIENIKNNKTDLIYIKDSLSSNYLELYGLRVAYHIRLSQELGDKRFIPIVILSDLDGCILNKLEPMARITFTKNIYIEPNSLQTIEKYKNKSFSKFDITNYQKEFLDLINVESPENSTNHSIANEWAIFKWANALEMYHPSNRMNINQILNKISFSLYFKYLKAKNNIYEPTEIDIKSLSKYTKNTRELLECIRDFDGNILYVDDDHSKGWGDIFNYFFSLSKSKDKISIIDFRNLKTYNQVEKVLDDTIRANKPDLILLDMRLIESDKHEENFKNISGIKLLEKIKSINPGIQVIMLSATTRSDILEQAYKDNKILGYIKKDHIDNNAITTKENIEKLSGLLKNGEEKFYLKEIWDIQKEILQLNLFENDQYSEIKIEIKSVFEILQTDMENKFIYALFALFKVIEIIIGVYIEEKKENSKRFAYWKNTNTKIKFIEKDEYFLKELPQNSQKSNDSTLNKIRVLCYEKFQLNSKEIHDRLTTFVQIRNETIHHPKDKKPLKPTKGDIEEWFKMLQTILSKLK